MPVLEVFCVIPVLYVVWISNYLSMLRSISGKYTSGGSGKTRNDGNGNGNGSGNGNGNGNGNADSLVTPACSAVVARSTSALKVAVPI